MRIYIDLLHYTLDQPSYTNLEKDCNMLNHVFVFENQITND